MKAGLLEEGQYAPEPSGPPVTIDLIDVSYAVMGANKKPKRLLKNVNLSFKAGTMCALMGPSGAGKSTLLDFIADRKLEGIYGGEILVDGKPRTDHFRLRTAYVLQDDVHIATLTVEEILYYSVWTRVPEAKTKEQIQARVNQLLSMLGIEHIRNSIVGDSMRKGISGGQMKRLSIAVELCCLPDVIFLDEPTSGLDSSISLEVMSAVRDVTGQHRLCVSTIHQPSPEVFGLFNKLVIMCAGRMVWFGSPMDAVTHFTSPSLGYRYVAGTNPAEFVIAVGGGTQSPEGADKPRTAAELEFLYKCSRYYSPPALNAKERFSDSTKGRPEEHEEDPVHTDILTQTKMLLSRTWLAKIRDWPDVRAQLMKNVIIGVLVGIVFSGQGDANSPLYNSYTHQPNPEVTNVSSLLFFSLMFTLVGNMQAIPYLASQMIIYRRELAANAYVTFPFWVAQSVTTLPLMIVNNFLFVILLYFQVKFPNEADYFFYYMFALLFANIISFYSAMWLAAATGNEQVAFALFPLMFLFTANFSGFAITINSVPPFWSFGPYLSYGRWLYEGLMVNQWEMFDTDDNPYPSNNGNVLAEYDFDGFNKNDTFWIGLLYIIGFSLMTYYSMLPPKKRLQKSGSMANNTLQESMRSIDTFAMVGGAANAVGDGFRKSSIVNAVSVVAVGDNYMRASSFAGVATVATSGFAGGHGMDKRANSIVGGVAAVRSLRSIQRRDSFDDAASDSDEEVDPVAGYAKSKKTPKHSKPPITVDFYRRSTGLIEQSEGCLLTFKNVVYEVPNREFSRSKAPGPNNRETLRLLNDVTGVVRPGQMCALMGASGAGKSTLLDVLAQRKNTGRITGEILYNGNVHLKSWAYVMQDNVHVGLLSVRQNLYFAAQLRLPEHWDVGKKEKRVDKILDMLGLTEVGNTVVGTATLRGISGGQLKRLSIGVEIVHMPNLMFLDEPTTGLDSHISFEVMAAVRNLANQNRTVLCTIHQPSSDTFNLFDTVLLMAKGRVIYFGRVSECIAYFSQGPYAFPYKPNSNVADYIIAVGGGFLAAGDGRKITGEELAEYYVAQQKQSSSAMVFSPDVTAASNNPMLLGNTAGIVPTGAPSEGGVKTKDQEETEALAMMKYNTSTWHQLKTLCHRLVLKTARDRRATVVATVRHIIVGIFYGSLYFQLATGTSPENYTNRLGLFFFTIMFMVIGHQQSIPAIMDDRLIFYRERGSKAYGAFSYWLSLWLVQLPLIIFNAFIYTLILFFMVGLENGEHTLSFFLYFIIVTSCTGYFIANLMAAISPSTQAALSYYPIVLFVNVSFSGFLVYIPRFPSWLGSWAPYISFMRYAFQGMSLAEFQNNDELPGGPAYISALGFDGLDIDTCEGVLFLWLIVFMFAFLAALKFFDFEQR